MNGSTKTVPLSMLRRHSVRLRKRSREQAIALAESWLAVPVHPIVVSPPSGDPPMYDVADGNFRLDGLELLGVTEVEVFVTDKTLTDDQLDDIGFVTAYHREGLDCFEQAQIVMHKRACGLANQDIARKLNINPGWASKLHSLADCLPEVREAAKAGRIGPNEWHLISQSADQLATLELTLNGASRETVHRSVKQPKASAVRTARIRCPLPSGVHVQVAGESLSLEESVEALKDALKAHQAAIAKGLNAKTAQRVWADMATAAG